MADIEIIVKIDANVYTRLFDNGIQDNEIATDDVWEMARAIRRGTPLPKGHGEMVYREDVCNELRYMDNNGCITRSVNHVIEDIKKGIPTIIEADKAESEDK